MAIHRLGLPCGGSLVAAVMLVLSACAAPGPTGPSAGPDGVVIDWPYPRATGSFSATIGAVRWRASHVSAFYVRGQGGEPDTFAVIGTDGRYSLNVGATVRAVGTFTTTSSLPASFEVIDLLRIGRRWVADRTQPSSHGTLSLTSVSANRATATFTFTGVGTSTTEALVVSNGVIDLTF